MDSSIGTANLALFFALAALLLSLIALLAGSWWKSEVVWYQDQAEQLTLKVALLEGQLEGLERRLLVEPEVASKAYNPDARPLTAPSKPSSASEVVKAVTEPPTLKATPEVNPKSEVPKPAPDMQPVIVTRTTDQGARALDTWAGERTWSESETEKLIELYREGRVVFYMAGNLRVDQRDVVYKIAREIFDCRGEIDELNKAKNNGLSWQAEDQERFAALFEAGKSVDKIAKALGRTQLAIVWRSIDQGLRR